MEKRINNLGKILDFEIDCFKLLINRKEEGEFEKALKSMLILLLETQPIQNLDQRLQLGLLHKANSDWTNVKHTRLEHSIGVVAKALVVSDVLNDKHPNILSKQDVLEICAAAALHDIGHLPISHAAERAILAVDDCNSGVRHEERIIPLLIYDNDYFREIKDIIFNTWGLERDSIYRIVYIIDSKHSCKLINKNGWKKPSKLSKQLISSEIDLDRLDYILRDSEKLKYSPVLDVKRIIADYINGLGIYQGKTLNKEPKEAIELYLDESKIGNAFQLLLSRVLLYKYVYFSKDVRAIEVTLTSLISEFLDKSIPIQPLHLISVGDYDFLDTYVKKFMEMLTKTEREELQFYEYSEIIKYDDKSAAFMFLISIPIEKIQNPSLRKEIKTNLNSRSYINKLKKALRRGISEKLAEKSNYNNLVLKKYDIILDIFDLKTGGGDLLIKKNNSYKILNDYMTGSNMHQLCTETRIDIFIKRSFSKSLQDEIKDYIFNEFMALS